MDKTSDQETRGESFSPLPWTNGSREGWWGGGLAATGQDNLARVAREGPEVRLVLLTDALIESLEVDGGGGGGAAARQL